MVREESNDRLVWLHPCALYRQAQEHRSRAVSHCLSPFQFVEKLYITTAPRKRKEKLNRFKEINVSDTRRLLFQVVFW